MKIFYVVKEVRIDKNDKVEKVLWQQADGDTNRYQGEEEEAIFPTDVREVLKQGYIVEMIKPNGASGGELKLDQWGNIFEDRTEGTLQLLPRF